LQQLRLQSFSPLFHFTLLRLLTFNHFLDLSLVFGFKYFKDGLLVSFLAFFILTATLLELLESKFELTLGFDQVTLVVIFLGLQELNLTLP